MWHSLYHFIEYVELENFLACHFLYEPQQAKLPAGYKDQLICIESIHFTFIYSYSIRLTINS
jgi:hypothetical protein